MLKLKNIVNNTVRRELHKEVRTKLKEKKSNKKLALDYFDFFYTPTFGKEWNTMRLAMLTGRKYTALVNNYGNFIETNKQLEKMAALNMLNFLDKYHINLNSNLKIDLVKNLNIFTFDNCDTQNFPSPKPSLGKLLNYYCIDGASLLPVFALDIKKDDFILDLCASPGGKTLAMLQTLLPRKIICKDINQGRLDRLIRMLKTYIPEDKLNDLVSAELNTMGSRKNEQARFDKVLVDVPCTNDRHSLHTDENNIFSKSRNEERSSISKKQAELLTQGILSCKLNGTIVYSTCSLSPIQNEGVVNSVLNSFENQNFRLKVESIEKYKKYFDYFFHFSPSCKNGLLVSPDIKKNFGPFYFCKISKIPK